jgi:phosphohistidine phosphatase
VTPPPSPVLGGRSLWLLRHAKAVADPPAGGDDVDRVLAPRGRRDATALGRLIGPDGKGLGTEFVAGTEFAAGTVQIELPQIALVSPAARTSATAELVLEGMAGGTKTEYAEELYGADPDEVLEILRLVPDAVSSVMVVGHNPTAHALAMGLLSSQDIKGRDLVAKRGFPTCALGIYRLNIAAWADVNGRCGTLLGLFVPPFDRS